MSAWMICPVHLIHLIKRKSVVDWYALEKTMIGCTSLDSLEATHTNEVNLALEAMKHCLCLVARHMKHGLEGIVVMETGLEAVQRSTRIVESTDRTALL